MQKKPRTAIFSQLGNRQQQSLQSTTKTIDQIYTYRASNWKVDAIVTERKREREMCGTTDNFQWKPTASGEIWKHLAPTKRSITHTQTLDIFVKLQSNFTHTLTSDTCTFLRINIWTAKSVGRRTSAWAHTDRQNCLTGHCLKLFYGPANKSHKFVCIV